MTVVFIEYFVKKKYPLNTENFEKQKDRFRKIVEFSGLNNTEFGRKVGISKQQVSNILAGSRDISDLLAVTMELVWGFRKEWSQYGIGPEMRTDQFKEELQNRIGEIDQLLFNLNRDPEAKAMLCDYFMLNPERQSLVKALVRNFKNEIS
ncbi:XRE family transcriptional regulator [Leptospira gomenensis]|uniref:XRE family transcriptional regulator n=1 Tax=Leptospira gomenensis TaxID=2484974 RepID=A0A5F1YER5_9LEPT|nr:helix-turn-helix transcriptional regulator [Leptospira gomenensis]TGK36202.1 XRE family transcriptional regulator [Leptospira gomenensis]TGK42760.1 XRE family transcriptional regulator [Leptospira gomenensis]TGK42948.1 XRE family transcriptional regulator [Leptospira gomenensis]TGK54959.1 XRE family transcriptional regulator [Leptospira gomenensis]